MVGVTTHHRRFAYEKQRHYPSRSRRWRSGHWRSRCRYRRRRGGAELHDEHYDPVHKQRVEYPDDDTVEYHNDTVVDDAEDTDIAARICRSPLPEHGQQVRLGLLQLGLWLELGFGLRRRSSGGRHHAVARPTGGLWACMG